MNKPGLSSILNKYLLITIALVAVLMAWDWIDMSSATLEEGTFRPESEFDAVTGASTTVGLVPSDYKDLSNPVSRTSATLSDSQIEEMVLKAIELQGGFEGIIVKGDKVLIKPNLVGADEPPGTGENTDVRVVKALIRIINDFAEGNVEIIIGEGTARTNDDITKAGSVWDNSGYFDLLTDPDIAGINVTLLNLNQTINDLVEIDLMGEATAAPHGGKYKVHKAILEADVYIVVPVMKIHETGLTCALKNQIGTAPGCYYGYNKMKGTAYYSGLVHDRNQRRWTTEEIVDLSNIAGVDFVVVDALMCLESYKTDKGNNRVRFNTIIAGADPVAVDHVCAKLFCLNPDDIAHITLAEKVGLGTNNPEKIWVKGATIDETKIKVLKNSSENGLFGQSNRTWKISDKFNGTDITTEYIPDEAGFVPSANEKGWSEPIYFFDDRIDLYSYFNASPDIVSYAYTNFNAPKDQVAELWLGADEAIWVYLNGAKVYSFSSVTSFSDGDLVTDKENINIKEGKNTLLVKTLHRYGDYSFTLNICEPEPNSAYAGNRVSGLYFYQGLDTIPGADTIPEHSIYTHSNPLISVFPNPCTNEAIIQFHSENKNSYKLYVYNLSGQLARAFDTKNYDENRIIWDLTSVNGKRLPSGQYILTNSSRSYTTKFMIE